VNDNSLTEQDIRSSLADTIDKEFTVQQISPGMEDVYAALEGQS